MEDAMTKKTKPTASQVICDLEDELRAAAELARAVYNLADATRDSTDGPPIRRVAEELERHVTIIKNAVMGPLLDAVAPARENHQAASASRRRPDKRREPATVLQLVPPSEGSTPQRAEPADDPATTFPAALAAQFPVPVVKSMLIAVRDKSDEPLR
jgi:hypothetical protein